jgi:hypothetical protein
MQEFLVDLWNGLVQQPWSLRAVIGACLGAFLFVVVPPLIGKKQDREKEVAAPKGGDGGSAQVGGKGLAKGGSGGQVAGKNAYGQGGAGGAASVGGSGTAIGGPGGQVTDR